MGSLFLKRWAKSSEDSWNYGNGFPDFTWLSLCACLHSNAFLEALLRSPSVRLDESPPIRPHFTLITSLKTFSQNAATF